MHVINILSLVQETLSQRGRQNGYDSKDGELKETTAEERSAGKIAEIFNMLSGRDLTTAEAWLFLISLKLARLQAQIVQGKDVSDNVIDLVAYAGLYGEEITNTKEPTKEHTAQDELKKLARILSGSDAPGEIRALTVTAQSVVDRLALLSKRKCEHSSWEETSLGMLKCCDCQMLFPNPAAFTDKEPEPKVGPLSQATAYHLTTGVAVKPCQHNHIIGTHLDNDFNPTQSTAFRCLDCGETGPMLAAINTNFRDKS